MNKDLIAIFEYLEREKSIKREIIIKAIEDSLRMAAKKTISSKDNVDVSIDPKTGEIEIYVTKNIVDVVEDDEEEISIEEAKKLASNAKVGQRIEIFVPPQEFGRIAVQAAKQIITQSIRGAERDVIYEEYRHRIGEIISGTIKRAVKRSLIVDLGKVEAVLPDRNIPFGERPNIGERILALLLEVRDTDTGGAEVVLSRSHPEFVSSLFAQEVPELNEGIITIEKIVREPGYRTKMAVSSSDSRIDPVGTCVGVRGTRIKNVIREINNEKIDVIPYSNDKLKFLENILSPVEIKRIKTNHKITVIINDEDYPTVIGKKGMNARMIAKILDQEIDFQKITDFQKLTVVRMAELSDSENPKLDQPLKIEGISSLIVEALISAGYDTIRKISQTKPDELVAKVPGINYLDLADKILEQTK